LILKELKENKVFWVIEAIAIVLIGDAFPLYNLGWLVIPLMIVLILLVIWQLRIRKG